MVPVQPAQVGLFEPVGAAASVGTTVAGGGPASVAAHNNDRFVVGSQAPASPTSAMTISSPQAARSTSWDRFVLVS
jgi:hypothetical protein